MPQFDADAIRARHLLPDVASRYGVTLTPDGLEWRACCPFHSEKTASFTIFAAGQRFHCFGCGSHGDVIDFVQEWDGLDFRAACESLDGPPSAVKPPPAARQNGHHAKNPYDGWSVATPPDNAPLLAPGVKTPPIANPKRGRPTQYTPALVHPYLNADGMLTGYVLRVDIGEGRKITPTILWMTGPDGYEGWSHGSMPEPRPIYGLAEIAAHPGKQVLIVEGEKCADAGNMVLGGKMVVASWCGGAQATARTDWTPLAGRRCVLWPDADHEGRKAMETLAGSLVGLGATVRMMDPEQDRPKGWDIADAAASRMDGPQIIAYAKARARDWTGPTEREVVPDAPVSKHKSHETRPHATASPAVGGAALAVAPKPDVAHPRPERDNILSLHGHEIPTGDALDDYRSHFITDENGKIKSKLSNNFFWMLRGHPETRGLFAWNDIAQGVFLMARPPWAGGNGPWQSRAIYESDVFSALTWMERQGLQPRKTDARDTIRNIASYTRYNPVWDYLGSLRWDGCPRLQGGAWEGDTVPPLSTEYLGAPQDEIFATFVTKWHVAAVARAFRPGCKADAMVIFESPQGKFKSTYLRTMATIDGHEYFADNVGDITHPGSIMLLQGCWIVEVAELAGFNRKEIDSVKAWLSRTTDRFVPKYEGEPREVPRNYIVAGTHNPSGHGYLKDPTGARRFWPVPIQEVDLKRVERDRDQIWAEAVHLQRSGMKWWLTADEEAQADALTFDRRVEDPWAGKINEGVKGLQSVTLDSVIAWLQIPISQQTEVTTKRISEHLKSAGYIQRRDRTWAKVGEMQQGEML